MRDRHSRKVLANADGDGSDEFNIIRDQ